MFSGWQWKAAVWGIPNFSTCLRPITASGEGIIKCTTSAQAAAFSKTCRLGTARRMPWLVMRCSTMGIKRIWRTAYLLGPGFPMAMTRTSLPCSLRAMANRRALMVVPLFASSNWSMTNTIFIRFNRSFLTFPSFLYPVPYFLSLTRPNRLVHRKTRIWVCIVLIFRKELLRRRKKEAGTRPLFTAPAVPGSVPGPGPADPDRRWIWLRSECP